MRLAVQYFHMSTMQEFHSADKNVPDKIYKEPIAVLHIATLLYHSLSKPQIY
jgi:hypothetical protein